MFVSWNDTYKIIHVYITLNKGQNEIIWDLRIILNDISYNSNNNKILQNRKKYYFIFETFARVFQFLLHCAACGFWRKLKILVYRVHYLMNALASICWKCERVVCDRFNIIGCFSQVDRKWKVLTTITQTRNYY